MKNNLCTLYHVIAKKLTLQPNLGVVEVVACFWHHAMLHHIQEYFLQHSVAKYNGLLPIKDLKLNGF